jgi:hypothetical protein
MTTNNTYEQIGRLIVSALRTGGRITIGVEIEYDDPVQQTTNDVHKVSKARGVRIAAPLAGEDDELRFAMDYVQPMAFVLECAMSVERAKANAERGPLG